MKTYITNVGKTKIIAHSYEEFIAAIKRVILDNGGYIK